MVGGGERGGGGVLHGPVGLSAEQITDGRNVLFVLKKHKRGPRGGGGGGIQLVAEEVGGVGEGGEGGGRRGTTN